ncbi:MAG: HpaII family restriction endonuclease [Porphyromonas sp.]|nr:HpaII family restriction endonuclease [Porphyromonas sp.]
MALKGNKGEWSELYAFFKLLADGRLYCGDGGLNCYDDKFYPILKIFRDDSKGRNTYQVNEEEKKISISGQNINIEVPQEEFKTKAGNLLMLIKNLNKETDFSDIEQFMNRVDLHSIKAKSSDKADIRIVIHNLMTGSKPELGYSIKSKLGRNPTLINANRNGTNFIFKVRGITSPEQIERFNSYKYFKDKFDYLRSNGVSVEYYRVSSDVLRNNLLLLDLGLERIISEELYLYYSGKKSNIKDITNLVSEKDPLGIMNDIQQPMYAYKVKQFLLAFALGMTCTTPWHGKFHASGGYIVVKEDGDIVCYHFFDRNDLEDYLFYNTYFDTPSRTRHEFGEIYSENGEYFIKLNLQIRFR